MPTVGVLGTLVWDTIHGPDDRVGPVTDWGGIAYSLTAFEAAAPEGWTVVPIIKVGEDLRERADIFLRGLRRVATLEHVLSVPEPNNRVELFYQDRSRRCERLRGGVPGWTSDELSRASRACEALYVNFIAGWEMDVNAARHMRRTFEGPTYADVHSLVLSVGAGGIREPRPLPDRAAWLSAFRLLQGNETELQMLAPSEKDRESRAAAVLSAGPEVVFVTLAEAGAFWTARAGTRWQPAGERSTREAPRSGTAPAEPAAEGEHLDPTGCGDVWGISCFMSLLDGDPLPGAVRRANHLASLAAGWRGTTGLVRHLSGTVRTGPQRGDTG